jgi:hypothetical protein
MRENDGLKMLMAHHTAFQFAGALADSPCWAPASTRWALQGPPPP